jgi:hypothetical protein
MEIYFKTQIIIQDTTHILQFSVISYSHRVIVIAYKFEERFLFIYFLFFNKLIIYHKSHESKSNFTPIFLVSRIKLY